MGSPGRASGTSPRDRRARYRRVGGDLYASDVMFDAGPDEHFSGLGQHQHGLLVAPVTKYGARERDVYLPDVASWLDAWTGNPVGAQGWVTAAAPLERIPVYLREGGSLTDLRAPA